MTVYPKPYAFCHITEFAASDNTSAPRGSSAIEIFHSPSDQSLQQFRSRALSGGQMAEPRRDMHPCLMESSLPYDYAGANIDAQENQ